MTTVPAGLRSAFATLLHLYPRAHRAVFADEMALVYDDVLADAQTHGALALWKAAGRELLALIGCGLLTRFSAQEVAMSRSPFSHAAGLGAARWGALAFGLTFALARLPIDELWRTSIWIALAAGALGGWLFSWIGAPGRARLAYAGAGALAFGLGYLVRVALAQALGLATVETLVGIVVVLVAEFAAVAITFGALVGVIEHDLRQAGRLAFVGVMSAILGTSVGFGVVVGAWGAVQAFDSWRPGFDGTLSAWVSTTSHGLIQLGLPAVAGLLIGALFGRAEANGRAQGQSGAVAA